MLLTFNFFIFFPPHFIGIKQTQHQHHSPAAKVKPAPVGTTTQALRAAAYHFNGPRFLLFAAPGSPLVSLVFVKYGEGRAICKALDRLGITRKSVIAVTLRREL